MHSRTHNLKVSESYELKTGKLGYLAMERMHAQEEMRGDVASTWRSRVATFVARFSRKKNDDKCEDY